MLLRLIDKDKAQYLDLSTFINCSPDRILFYYYNSYIRITLETYQQMKEWPQNDDTSESCLNQWLDLIDRELCVDEDIEILKKSRFIESLGPYYLSPTNTQFYIDKTDKLGKGSIKSVDFAVLFSLHKKSEVDKELHKYYKVRKNTKKGTPPLDIIIKDISMCLAALEQIQRINQQCHYLQSLIKHRNDLLENEDLVPAAPAPRPERPKKPAEPDLSFTSIRALTVSKAKQKAYQDECSAFGHKLKVYFVQYREFEKASERYKEALIDWDLYHNHLIERCLDDTEDAEEKLETSRELLEIYQYILLKSFVHPDYHELETLNNFRYYLQTGRANDLQTCMNIYEEEQHWSEIKASQERIENTIYFLQGENDFTGLNEQLTLKMIASTVESEKSGQAQPLATTKI